MSRTRGHHNFGDFHQKVHEFFIFHDFCVVTTLFMGERLEVARFRVSAGWKSNMLLFLNVSGLRCSSICVSCQGDAWLNYKLNSSSDNEIGDNLLKLIHLPFLFCYFHFFYYLYWIVLIYMFVLQLSVNLCLSSSIFHDANLGVW